MKFLTKVILLGGFQNVLQFGLLYPLNMLATIFFINRARYKLCTTLDFLIAGYVVAGIISLVTGLMLALTESANFAVFFNAVKSFLIFLTVLVYFGAYRLELESYLGVALIVFGVTVAIILATYLYIVLTNPISIYLSRSAITWASGWPQRWVVFCLVGHFIFLCRYDFNASKIILIFSLGFLAAILLSGTRSAILGLLVGYASLSILNRRDLVRTLIILGTSILISSFFIDELSEAFRIQELTNYSSSNAADGSSMNDRIHNLWPGIIDSLGYARILFGWGHVGLAYIPHEFFVDTSLLSNIPGEETGSAESQYMDVLLRQGFVGLVLFISIHICGLIYSYKLYKFESNAMRRLLWKAAFAWQAAIFVHGVTVETIRYPLYNLFYFLFLGILSNSYYHLVSQHKTNVSAHPSSSGLSRPTDA